ncbi:hypothetical protein WDV93_02300 [Pantoea ananatis]
MKPVRQAVHDSGPALLTPALHELTSNVEVLGAVNLPRSTLVRWSSVIGPSGSGKKPRGFACSITEQIDNGEIRINGKPFIHLRQQGEQRKPRFVERHRAAASTLGWFFRASTCSATSTSWIT